MIGLDLIITIQHSLECQNLVAAITPNANQDLALAPPPLSSVGLAITHQAQVSIAPQTSNANQDLALAPPPLSSVGLAITHQAQVSIAPQTTSGFARAYQTFISNLGNSGTYQDINVGIESNTDLPLEVAHVLMDLHQNINDPRFVKSQKGKPLLFFQDYLYRQDYQKDNKIHYRCRKVGCKASCKFDVIYITSGLHEHQNEIDIFEKLRTHEVLEDIVAENPLETRHYIYEKAINKRFLETPNINFYPEAMPSFISLSLFPHSIWTRYQVNGPRTNNYLEGYHHSIKRKTLCPHPNIYSLINILKRHQHASEIKLIQINSGLNVNRKNRKYIQLNILIQNLTSLYDRNMDVYVFLDNISNLIKLQS
ncbi:uncharacterized protein LOC135926362 isoform X2 [Gordionus sp. m RMFG-2023]|uniref:uncharacterized protein LOC135926362 isoform X2 n=1 Tax=Gordionus sp. m RMFG-2023 TaxID=3053472 RepID=UPI0031FBF1C5